MQQYYYHSHVVDYIQLYLHWAAMVLCCRCCFFGRRRRRHRHHWVILWHFHYLSLGYHRRTPHILLLSLWLIVITGRCRAFTWFVSLFNHKIEVACERSRSRKKDDFDGNQKICKNSMRKKSLLKKYDAICARLCVCTIFCRKINCWLITLTNSRRTTESLGAKESGNELTETKNKHCDEGANKRAREMRNKTN